MIKISNSSIRKLQENKGKIIHVIDPFKSSMAEAVEKAKFFSEVCPFIIIGSTDNDIYHEIVPEMIQKIKESIDVSIFTHFPPKTEMGYPSCADADAVIATSVLNSGMDYYRDNSMNRQSLKETVSKGGVINIIPCSAITLGDDKKSKKYVDAQPVSSQKQSIDRVLDNFILPSEGIFYLYSRNCLVDTHICKYVRSRVDSRVVLIVSGCIREKEQADCLIESGADYVAVGTLFESMNWKEKALDFFLAPTTA